ncbi:MAG: hypothetical protein HQ567_25610, partial [Candidatus Nealsonbacteria bacterium]|nr:hypothetical protein [Candidatus Nealsonbacteria bacterium]
MKRRLRFTALAIAMIAVVSASTTVEAAQYQWDAGGADAYWNTLENWKYQGTVPQWGNQIPVDDANDLVNIGGSLTIDLNGIAVNLPSMRILTQSTLQDLSVGKTATITCDTFQPNGNLDVVIPVVANTLTVTGSTTKYYDSMNVETIDITAGNQYFYHDISATVETKFTGVSFYSPIGRLLPDPVTPGVYPTLTTPSLQVSGLRGNFFAEGTVDTSAVAITTAFKYHVKRPDALGDAATTVTISNAGYLGLDVPLAAFPQVTAGAYGILAGNMTGATFGDGGNVTLQENSVYVPLVAPTIPPTQASAGIGAIVWEGMNPAKAVYTSGDDGTSIFKGPAIGHWSPNVASNFTVQAISGSGAVQFLVANSRETWANPKIGGNTTWIGDDNGTPGDNSDDVLSATITVQPHAEAGLWLDYALNEKVDYSEADNSYVTTFDVVGRVGAETGRTLFFGGANRELVRAEQTLNISNGTVSGGNHWSNWYLGGNMHGKMSLTNCLLSPVPTGLGFDADDGYLSFHETVVLQLGNQAFLEPLGDRFSYDADGRMVILLGNNDIPAIDYAANPVMADLLINADITHSSYGVTRLATDLKIGHGKYLYSSFHQTNSNGFDTTTGAKIVPAGNAPVGVQSTLGFAATVSDWNLNVEIDAPGAMVIAGTTDPDRILYGSWGFSNVPADKIVNFKQTVTADGINIESGGLTISGATTKLVSAGAAVPFLLNFDSIDAARLLIQSGAIDDDNPVVITGNAGANMHLSGTMDLSNTTVIANAGLTKMTAGGNNSVLVLGNLDMNTEVVYGSNNGTAHLEVTGRLSGTGVFTSNRTNNSALVKSTGTVAPGDDGVGTLNQWGRQIRLEDDATFEIGFLDPAGEAGTGWDLLCSGDLLDFDVDDSDAGIINIALMDAGMTTDILDTQEFAVAARENGTIDTPGDWNFIA